MEEISRKVNLIELITPINVKEQKHIWLERAASKDFSFIPKFDYDQKKLRAATQNIESIFDIKHRLAYIEIDNQKEASMVQLAMNRANNLLSTICMVGSIMRGDDFQTKKIAYGKFGGIDARASAFAAERALLLHSGDMPSKSKVDSILTDEEINRLESLNFDASEIAYWFLWAIKQYGFDYRLEISQTATAIDVRDSSSNGKPVIVIPVKRRVSGRKLITLLRHEIECHARDSYNGRIMLNGLGGVLRADDDIIYEGHAMYEEAQTELRLFGNDSHLPLPWYTIAINMAESGASVEEIANNIY